MKSSLLSESFGWTNEFPFSASRISAKLGKARQEEELEERKESGRS